MKKNFKPFTLNLKGQLRHYDRQVLMGIVNVTPDSFYPGSRALSPSGIKSRVESMVKSDVDIIDLGAYSSRPGADDVAPDEELRRLEIGMKALREVAPDTPVSIDTFRSDVARIAIQEFGADMINDISGGTLDNDMFTTVADLKVPYILMHMRGKPDDMQSRCNYDDDGGVTRSVIISLKKSLDTLRRLGVADVIVDPGFGFAKTVDQNYTLLSNLPLLSVLDCPILVGVSRKSMLYKPLGLNPDKSLNATTAANVIALIGGASILRVHDVDEAREARAILELTYNRPISIP